MMGTGARIGRLAAAAAVAIAIPLGGAAGASPVGEVLPAAVGHVRIVGTPETVFDWATEACEAAEIPDLPVRAFRDYRGRVQLLLSHYENFRLIGPSLKALHRDCHAVMRSPENGSPARFEGREWLGSLYTTDGRTVWALVHDEYQGNRYPRRCASRSYFRCWYNAITVARSTDGGGSYRHAPAPHQLVAGPATPFRGGGGPVGVFAPSNIVTGPHGAYFALVRVRAPDGTHGDCLLRSTNVGSPESWQTWNGAGFVRAPGNPYLGTAHAGPGCAPISVGEIAEMTESLTYDSTLGRYLLLGLAPPGPLSIGAHVSGIYFSTSRDLIHWSPRTLIAPTVTVPTYRCGERSPIAYPSVVQPGSSSRTFATSGGSPFLYFTQFHYHGCHRTPDRDLMRVRLAISP